MQISPEFKNLIDLYRLLNRPTLVGEKFKCEIQCSVEIETLLRALWRSDKFDLVINTFETESRDEFPNEITNNLITIEVKLPQNERGKFYENLDQWVVTAEPLTRGQLTQNTYLLKEDLLVSQAGGSF